MTERALPKILVVDRDDEFRRRVCRLIVSSEVGRPVQASDGETAVATAYEYQPSLVLLENALAPFIRDAVAGALDIVSPQSLLILLCEDEDDPPRYADGAVRRCAIESLLHCIAPVGRFGSHDDVVDAWVRCATWGTDRSEVGTVSLHRYA